MLQLLLSSNYFSEDVPTLHDATQLGRGKFRDPAIATLAQVAPIIASDATQDIGESSGPIADLLNLLFTAVERPLYSKLFRFDAGNTLLPLCDSYDSLAFACSNPIRCAAQVRVFEHGLGIFGQHRVSLYLYAGLMFLP